MEFIAVGITNVKDFFIGQKEIQPDTPRLLKENMTFLIQEVPEP